MFTSLLYRWMDWFKNTASSPSSIAAIITISVVALLIYRQVASSILEKIISSAPPM
jgi:hypothetical protein